jgi:hypothetical protein
MRSKKGHLRHLLLAIEEASGTSWRGKRARGRTDVMMTLALPAISLHGACWIGCHALTF